MRDLRSSSMSLLHKPRTRTHFADHTFCGQKVRCTFCCTKPSVWNSLNNYTVDSSLLAVFKSRLKTFLFCQTFTPS